MELDIIDVSKNDRRPAPARSVPRERRPQQKGQVDRNRGGNPGTGRDPGRSPRRNPQRGQNGNIRRVSDRDLDRNMRRMPDRNPGRQFDTDSGRRGNRIPEREPVRAPHSRSGSAPVRRRSEDRRQQQERIRRKKKRRRQKAAVRAGAVLLLIAIIILLIFALVKLISGARERDVVQKVSAVSSVPRKELLKANKSTQKPVITEDFLTVNEFSRPGEELKKVNNIFVHYTANRETSAAQNRSYFENLGITGETSASAHFIIGYEGEIIQCIPLNEIAYAVQKRNYDSISIECCYLSEDGKFTDATYQSLLRLSAWLLKEYKLTPEDMMRHYDEGGKKCPLYYVEHEGAWEQFLRDLEQFIMDQENGSV